ncbi:MAG: hypothetical protein M3379_09010 [Acidobacteriota bacterium]|nr:hypothetical protein [Acidobacteriota bacterium]
MGAVMTPIQRADAVAAEAASDAALLGREKRRLEFAAKRAADEPPARRAELIERISLMEPALRQAILRRDRAERDLNGLLVAERGRARASLEVEAGSLSHALRAASLNYGVFIRRHMGGSLHTEVPRLIAEPYCSGDLLREGTFVAYFDAVANEKYAEAAATLAVINSQLSCLSTRQVARLELVMIAGLGRAIAGYSPDDKKFSRAGARFASLMSQIAAGPMFLLAEQTRHFKRHHKLALQWFEINRGVLKEAARDVKSPLYHAGLPVPDRLSGRLGFVTSKCQPARAGPRLFRGRRGEPYLKFSDGKGGESCNPLAAMLDSTGLPCGARDWVAAGNDPRVAEAFTCAPSCRQGKTKPSKDVVKEYFVAGSGLRGFYNPVAVEPKYQSSTNCDVSRASQPADGESAEGLSGTLGGVARACGENPVEERFVTEREFMACLDAAAEKSSLAYRSGFGSGGRPGGGKCQVTEEEEEGQNPPPPIDTQPDGGEEGPEPPLDPGGPPSGQPWLWLPGVGPIPVEIAPPAPPSGQRPDDVVDPNFGNPPVGPTLKDFENFLEGWVTTENEKFNPCLRNCGVPENLLLWERGKGESKEYMLLNTENMRWFWFPERDRNVPGLVEQSKNLLSNSSKQPKGTSTCSPDAMNCGSCTAYDANATAALQCAPGYEEPDLSREPKYPEGYDPKLGPLINPDTYTEMHTKAEKCAGGGLTLSCPGASTTLCAEDRPNCACPDAAPTFASRGKDCTRVMCGGEQVAATEGTLCTCTNTVDMGIGSGRGPTPEVNPGRNLGVNSRPGPSP